MNYFLYEENIILKCILRKVKSKEYMMKLKGNYGC